jgi:hypothetical protein
MHPILVFAVLVPVGIFMLIFAYKSGPPAVDEADDDILDEALEPADENNIPHITSLPAAPPIMIVPVVKKPVAEPPAAKAKIGDSGFKPHLRDAVNQQKGAVKASPVGRLSGIGR